MAGILILLRRIKGIIPMLKDRAVPWWKKAILIAAIIYLILPVDLIPPLVPVFGWLDDIILWIAILYFMRTELDEHIPGKNTEGKKHKYDFNEADVLEANFSVVDDEVSDGQN